ncbi:MAG: glycosyltransferase [Acidobacteriota bacterium]|nr:glycosyltransferase [Acidobacteriota bacterium]
MSRAAKPVPPQTGASRRLGLRVFLLCFAALWLAHAPWLRLPYFWDEAGYFIPAARDLLLYHQLVPHTTLSNAHPPLVMIYLAMVWKLTAYTPLITRTAMLLVAASGFTALWLLARRVADTATATATATVILTALTPVVFSQSCMAQLDVAAFALVMWMLLAHITGRRRLVIVLAALAAVAKETTVVVTLTLFGADLLGAIAYCWRPQWAARWCLPRRSVLQSAAYLLALLPLAAWYAYHHHVTGHVFGNPDYLRYNVGATVTPLRIALAFVMRVWHAVGYMNLFVLTAAALMLGWDAHRSEGPDPAPCRIPCAVRLLLALVVLAQIAEFSVVGGALLARYMTPAIPFVVLLATDVVRRRAPRWPWWIAACAAASVAALFFNPPWFISPEDNLTWTHYVQMHEDAARYVEQHYPGERILTAWTASDELNRPWLGYVRQPLTIVRAENFSLDEMMKAQKQSDQIDVVVAFSTKYEPGRALFQRIPGYTRIQTRYFDFHQDLPPRAIAGMLGGRIVWREDSPGEWIAVIEIEKARNARLEWPR